MVRAMARVKAAVWARRLAKDLQRDLQWSVSGYWTPCWRGRAVHVAQGRLRWVRGLRLPCGLALRLRRTAARKWVTRRRRRGGRPDPLMRNREHALG